MTAVVKTILITLSAAFLWAGIAAATTWTAVWDPEIPSERTCGVLGNHPHYDHRGLVVADESMKGRPL